MPDNNDDKNFDKGARIINAVIAETDLPADLKVNVQDVVTKLLTHVLPGLLTPLVTVSEPAPDQRVSPPSVFGEERLEHRRTSAARSQDNRRQAGYRLISMALDSFLGEQQRQTEDLSVALMVAFRSGANPMQISEVLLAAAQACNDVHQQVVDRILALPSAFGAKDSELH